ncbi:MAG: hypothetical protein CVT88_08465 [Candidatus Altiarchaeales archaeon HGW-Altiarchaeales-1]|nr:MAG: hypothetical protein CVT88_08465 [Candidatus Altiarchaeales archaeon HGW-Altiarchaeales-1]PKP57856.1 MAG: hypothetical protein CVT89_03795 [Candidatus Altiarchaeales archaeon HGW-Altiarchaeales-2]
MTDVVINVFNEELIVRRLMNLDKELHSIIYGLTVKKHKHKEMSLSELNKIMEKDRISDIDSTQLIRQMRDKKYEL